MTIQLEKETEETFDFDAGALLHRVIAFVLEDADFPYEAEINIVLTDDAGIRKTNRTFRGLDAATDVLSFPALEYERPGDFSFLQDLSQEEELMYCNPDTGELMLGDMMLSVPRVKQQAAEYGHSSLRELAFLTVHSMLHLFGYDHMEEEARVRMEAQQDRIMEALGILR